MRTILAIVGALALLVILAIVAVFVSSALRMPRLAKEAKVYVDASIPAIAATWDGEALYARAAPEFQQVLDSETLGSIMAAGASQFGPLTDYQGAACEAIRVELALGSPETAFAECTAAASFARVDGRLRVSAVKREGDWKLFAFYVDPVAESDEPAEPAAHARAKLPTVFEASFAEGYVAVSAPGTPLAGAEVGDVRAAHVPPQ